MIAAQGALAPRAHEQLAILLLLLDDRDEDIRQTARATLDRIPAAVLSVHAARPDVPARAREYLSTRATGAEGPAAAAAADDPLIDTDAEPLPAAEEGGTEDERRQSLTQQISRMSFTQRLKAAVKGTREMRAVLIRDPNKMIAATVLSSPKLTENEVEAFARMANLNEDVLRIIGSNRAWTRNYGVIVGLTRNPKTPLAMSLNFLPRLNERDVQLLSIDRNVPEPLRVAARKRLVLGKG